MTEPTLIRPDTALVPARRTLLVRGTQAVLSASAVAILAGCESMAMSKNASAATASDDIQVLNTALGLEYEGIAAYQVGAESGLLTKPVLAVAVKFQDHHKKHADVLASTVKKLGGTPVTAKAKYDFPTGNLKTQEDVLRFAAGLEQGAAQAYYAPCRSSPTRISPRPPPASWPTRRCIGRCCAAYWARIRSQPPSRSPDR
ncbi:hypothetical protein FRZ44_01980 [Hypericibacter terrae]|uniref:DUF4439 domain-containing protein n=1 Tax=Hypericibacter terrae TaxID=2602015 RepID=A0A5J6MCH5_9PROT|nr:ferritin-like domain-containing protein [Hypericibacter terrae]QEX14922.1 hypothetical protein FRZ44_01980 [Hypericibacter terrae]